MPTKKPRNYRKEYIEYHGRPDQKAKRASRNRARHKMAKAGLVRKGDGKDIDHKDGNPQNNKASNLKVVSRSYNRAKK